MKLTKEEYKKLSQYARRCANSMTEVAKESKSSQVAATYTRESYRWYQISDALESGEVS
jgi:hypothetical protein